VKTFAETLETVTLRLGSCRAKPPETGLGDRVICCCSFDPLPPVTKEVMVAVTALAMVDQVSCKAAGVVVPTANFTVFDE
jgi:hypothetical protein